jgi:hypothetical protein
MIHNAILTFIAYLAAVGIIVATHDGECVRCAGGHQWEWSVK